MGVILTPRDQAMAQPPIQGTRRFPYQATADPIFRPEIPYGPTPETQRPGAPGSSGVIGRRQRFLYSSGTAVVLQPTPAGIAPDYNRPLILPGGIGRRQRFLYTPAVMPVIPQPGEEVPFDPAASLSWQAVAPSLHLRRRVPLALLLRTRPDTPWDIDISVSLWQPTYPDLHWRNVRVLWPASAVVTIPPEPDISPVHWLANYPPKIDPLRGLPAAHQMAFQYFLDAPNTLTDLQWFQPASLPSSTRMPPPRYYLQFATFDRDLTQGGDPTVVVIGEVWRRRNMKAPVGMLVRPILPGLE